MICNDLILKFVRFPFQWKTPVGYLLAIFIESISILYACTFSVSMFCFLIATCFMQMALADDILSKLIAMNEHCTIYGDYSKFSNKFRTFIEMQEIGRQLSQLKFLKVSVN